jgi:type I restriction enzyme S subunit
MKIKKDTLRNLSTVVSKGTTPTTYGYEFQNEGIPFLRAEDVLGGYVDITQTAYFIDEAAHSALSRSQLKKNDLLITIAGTLGRVGLVPENVDKLNCNQAVAFVRLKSEIILPEYALYYCNSPQFIESMSEDKVTGTISNLNLENIRNAVVHYPEDKTDQQKFVDVIKAKFTHLESIKKIALKQLVAIEVLPSSILREILAFDGNENNYA